MIFNKSGFFFLMLLVSIFNTLAYDHTRKKIRQKTIYKTIYEVCTTDADHIGISDLEKEDVPIQYLTMI